MTWLHVVDDARGSMDAYAKVLEAIGEPPRGLLARFAGPMAQGIRVVSVWDSPEDADRFFTERLGPAFAQVYGEPGGAPVSTDLEVADLYLRSGG
jgi:hypothetical protein